MTKPDTSEGASGENNPRHPSRDERLENLVDDLQDNVEGELEAEGVPRKASQDAPAEPPESLDEPTG
jgi:hypothetical protein